MKKAFFIRFLGLFVLFSLTGQNMMAQFFEGEKTFFTKNAPCVAFIYKYPISVVEKALLETHPEYEKKRINKDYILYYRFSGALINAVVLAQADIVLTIEPQGPDKCILYATAMKNGSEDYTNTFRFATVQQKMRSWLEEVELQCIDVQDKLYILQQYEKIATIKHDLQFLYEKLTGLERLDTVDVVQMAKVKSAIRIKKAQLREEDNILNNLLEVHTVH